MITVVVGGQYGSEGKGSICSFLANEFKAAVRTGGPNAGHTVIHNGCIYKMRQLPSAFINQECELYIGAGAQVDLKILESEVALTNTQKRFWIDENVRFIENRDIEQEASLVSKIRSTGSGTGMATIAKIMREPQVFQGYNHKKINVANKLNDILDFGHNVLVEGTQGFGLSIHHGNYPWVTSRDTTAASFLAEAGLSPLFVRDIILVIRTHPIRVAFNSGPLPMEISWEDLSKTLGKNIIEYSTCTNNIRRIAKFDNTIVRRAIQCNRPTMIALNFLDYIFPELYGKTELHGKAIEYLNSLENLWGIKIGLVGMGNNVVIDRRKS